MATPYTFKRLTDIEDSAPKFGFGEIQQARFANAALETERTGIGHFRLAAEKRQPFAHRHDEAEEIYIVLSGSGRVKLDEEIVEVGALDAIRVAPEVTRCFESGPDGLELIAVGRRHDGDGEVVPGWWQD